MQQKLKWSALNSDEVYQAFTNLHAQYRQLLAQRNIPRFHGSWAEHQQYLDVHETVILGDSSSCDIKHRPEATGVCIEIGECSQLFGCLSIQVPGARIKIGKRTQIGSGSIIASDGITIGDDVLMSWNITVMDTNNHALDFNGRRNDVLMCGLNYLSNKIDLARNRDWSDAHSAPIEIKNKAWIGFGSAILKGVTVGEGAVVGAHSVVTKDVPAYTIVAGNPAKVVRELPPTA